MNNFIIHQSWLGSSSPKKQTVMELYVPPLAKDKNVRKERALWSTLRRCYSSCMARQEESDYDFDTPQR
jgi:hypothetical protein